jgi:single-stranded DNA-binding protein
MVIVSVFGTVASQPRSVKTQAGGTRVFFDVLSEDAASPSLDFYYQCVTFGAAAERVINQVAEGDKIFVSGRLTAGGAAKKVNLSVSAFEIATEEEPSDASQDAN